MKALDCFSVPASLACVGLGHHIWICLYDTDLRSQEDGVGCGKKNWSFFLWCLQAWKESIKQNRHSLFIDEGNSVEWSLEGKEYDHWSGQVMYMWPPT